MSFDGKKDSISVSFGKESSSESVSFEGEKKSSISVSFGADSNDSQSVSFGGSEEG